jgi:uncharacterized integral membrane protein
VRFLISGVILLLLVVFCLSNAESVVLAIWPTDLTVAVPLSLAILAALGLGLALGALSLWFSALHYRREAKRARDRVRQLEARIAASAAESVPQPSRAPLARLPGAAR